MTAPQDNQPKTGPQEVNSGNLLKPISEKLTHISARLRAEADEKRKQTKDLNKLAENIDEANKLLWSNPDINNRPLPKSSEQIVASAGASVFYFNDYLNSRPLGEIGKKELYQFIKPSGDLIDITNTSSSIAVAHHMGLSLPPPRIHEDEAAISFVESNLPTEHLRRMFKEAWDSFYASAEDPNRAAGFMMREVVTHIFHHEAPTEEVKKSGITLPEKKPTKVERSEYIIAKNSGPGAEVMRQSLKNLRDVYDSLNLAHAQESLEAKRTRIKSFLLQATYAIYLYLRNK